MKQNRKETGSTGSEITFVKKASAAFGAGAVAMLAVGAVGLYAFVGGNDIPVNENAEQTESAAETSVSKAAVAVTNTESKAEKAEAPKVSAVFEGYDRSVSRAAVTIRKAGLDEYDLILETVKATEAPASSKTADTSAEEDKTDGDSAETTTSKKNSKKTDTKSKKKTDAASDNKKTEAESVKDKEDTDTDKKTETSAKKTSSKKKTNTKTKTKTEKKTNSNASDANEPQSEVKACAAMTLFSTDKVNLRKAASLDADVLLVLPVDAEVIVTGYTEDWYRVKFDGNSGYCMKKYFTEAAPEHPAETTEKTGDVISYNSTEFDMLCYVLQGEVGNCSEASKIAVANVIINRVKDPRFPDTIEGVLTQPAQFDAIYGYYGGYTVPSENTIECAKRALAGEDNTNGAIYYYAPQYVGGDVSGWFESLQFCLELDGQRYFK